MGQGPGLKSGTRGDFDSCRTDALDRQPAPADVGGATYALREPLPVLTLALTRNLVAWSASLDGRTHGQLTPFRTTNGATLRSSRAYQRPPRLLARPGEACCIRRVTRSPDRPRRRGVAADRHYSRTTRAACRAAKRRNCTTTPASTSSAPVVARRHRTRRWLRPERDQPLWAE